MQPTVAYLLPIASITPPDPGLTAYLWQVAGWCDEVIVVDSSCATVFDAAHEAWSSFVRHVPVDPTVTCANGKVRGVLTGLPIVAADVVVIADDDVRFEREQLEACVRLLAGAELVHPQNHFEPAPWHARWDTGRILVNRATGHDLGGASVVVADVLRRTGGYDGDVLFENLELMRTVRRAGGRVRFADDVFVRRLPPTTRHFLGQRVRQAYDELARPRRLLAQLALAPVALSAARRPRRLVVLLVASMAIAEIGRRRAAGRSRFPWTAPLWAPLWLLERATCSWLALLAWCRGGAAYHGRRIRRAANHGRRGSRPHVVTAAGRGMTGAHRCPTPISSVMSGVLDLGGGREPGR